MSHTWQVVPLSKGQLLDVRPEDVLDGGLYRRCDTYRGGGGYDQFPKIASERLGDFAEDYRHQFVVQLRGCNLDCPYCYVTRAGVWGDAVRVSTGDLVDAFRRSGAQVFHLMGGAPALQMRRWSELLDELGDDVPFHSDLLLTESDYDPAVLEAVARPLALYAIDVKGLTSEDWLRNTRKPLNKKRFWRNWRLVQDSGVQAYVTFTNVSPLQGDVGEFISDMRRHGIDIYRWCRDWFEIDLVEYDALPHVDDTPWGGRR